MDAADIVRYVVAALVGGVVVARAVHLVWHVRGRFRIRQAGVRILLATNHRIWEDPNLDLRYGPGGAEYVPAAPFTFLEEHLTGSQPCVAVRDARGRRWRVKWGHEVHPESFAVRFAAACGYFAEVTHYFGEGAIDGARGLTRAGGCLDEAGRFRHARFELEDRTVRMLFDEDSWAWNDNPFFGTPQLSGLKLIVMLLSNWDTKDRRDVARGSNTAIFEVPRSRWRYEARYLISDWGASMGRWGSNLLSRGRWDPAGFAEQTASFVEGVDAGIVRFGYRGQRTQDIAGEIPVTHVRWFCSHAARLTRPLLHEGLLASGATDAEAKQFSQALLDRIAQLRAV